MNTKPIPAIITLIAACISCVASLIGHVGLEIFTMRLLVTVICFLAIGSVVKLLMDKGLKQPEEPASDHEEENGKDDSSGETVDEDEE